MTPNVYVAIMAGGVGSRFWPGSRESYPKQFLDMMGTGKSLLRLTFERFLPLCPAANILVVTNKAYKHLVLEQLPEISERQILCEPSRNNTAPSIAYTAFRLAAQDPDANFVIASSDQIVLKEQEFLNKIKQALAFTAEHNALVTLGIQPTRPDTGYGYIQFGEESGDNIRKVIRFTEKPNAQIAADFVNSGEYLWNAGIFIWNVQAILQAFETYAPDIYQVLEPGKELYNTPAEQDFIDTNYPRTRNISVDFAIMEKSPNVFTIPADIGWSDLGTWASLHHEAAKDEYDNVVQSDKALVIDCDNLMLKAPNGKLVVLKDLSDYIVIDTEDVLLVYPKSKEQEIRQVTNDVRENFGNDYL